MAKITISVEGGTEEQVFIVAFDPLSSGPGRPQLQLRPGQSEVLELADDDELFAWVEKVQSPTVDMYMGLLA